MSKQSCGRFAALESRTTESILAQQAVQKLKQGVEFKTLLLMNFVEQYKWSRTLEEILMQNKLFYNVL